MAPRTALLVVDVQTGLFTGPEAVFDGPALLARIREVIAQARRAQSPVVFVQDDDVAPVGTREWEVHPALEAFDSDTRVRKGHADAFFRTSLLETLGAGAVHRLVVVGCTTDACIDMTCRSAVRLGFDVVLVKDGHTTRDNRFMNAAQSIEYYNIILDGFGATDCVGNGDHEVTLAAATDDLFANVAKSG